MRQTWPCTELVVDRMRLGLRRRIADVGSSRLEKASVSFCCSGQDGGGFDSALL
jgi:hypothetical protein